MNQKNNKKAIIFDLDGTLIDLSRTKITKFISKKQIAFLANRYRIGLVTGCLKNDACAALKAAKILEYFDKNLIVTFEDTLSLKETGKPFFEISRRLPGCTVVFIGDSPNDEVGARKAEMPFIQVQKANSLLEQKKYLRKAILKAVKF